MLNRLTVEIRTDNDAFADGNDATECARILRLIAESLERGTRGMPLHDFNGNRVGRFDLTRVED